MEPSNSSTVPLISTPTEIETNPAPPNGRRVRRSIAIGTGCFLALITGMGYYGMIRPRTARAESGAATETKGIRPAIATGEMIVAQAKLNPAGTAVRPPGAQPATVPADLTTPPPGASLRNVEASVNPYPSVQPPIQPLPKEPTAEEKARALAYQREMDAIASPMTVGNGNWGGNAANASTSAAASTPPTEQTGDPRDPKEAFLDAARAASKKTYLIATRTAPLSKYEVKAGWYIPAITEMEVNTDTPGEERARVREGVYDTATGRYLLIPAGTILVGTYNSQIGYGDGAVSNGWTRMIFPDGSSLNIEGMLGYDVQGQAAFRDKVDRHYTRLFGMGLVTSAFSAAAAIAQNRRGGLLAYPSPTETASTAASSQMSQLGVEVTRKNLNVQPTIKIRPGYRFNVFVRNDLLFEAPYVAMRAK